MYGCNTVWEVEGRFVLNSADCRCWIWSRNRWSAPSSTWSRTLWVQAQLPPVFPFICCVSGGGSLCDSWWVGEVLVQHCNTVYRIFWGDNSDTLLWRYVNVLDMTADGRQWCRLRSGHTDCCCWCHASAASVAASNRQTIGPVFWRLRVRMTGVTDGKLIFFLCATAYSRQCPWFCVQRCESDNDRHWCLGEDTALGSMFWRPMSNITDNDSWQWCQGDVLCVTAYSSPRFFFLETREL